MHRVTVIERHADWQVVEYRYGNSHDSTSRYRAYRDRIEPLAYRMTMSMGFFVSALVLLLPVWIASRLINAIWNAVVRRRKSPDVA